MKKGVVFLPRSFFVPSLGYVVISLPKNY